MSFQSFFVARISDGSVGIICKHDSPKKTVKELPSTKNLGAFCFPLGVQHVAQREYMAADVRIHGSFQPLHKLDQMQGYLAGSYDVAEACSCTGAGVYVHSDRR